MVQPRGREFREAVGETDGRLGRGVEEGGVKAELAKLRGDRVDEFGAAVTHIHAPQPGEAIEELAAHRVLHIDAFAGDDDVRSMRMHLVVIREGMEVESSVESLKRRGEACHEGTEP